MKGILEQNRIMRLKPLAIFWIFLGLVVPILSIGADKASEFEFKVRKADMENRFKDFYARKERQREARAARQAAVDIQRNQRIQKLELRERSRINFKRVVPVPDEEGERLQQKLYDVRRKKRQSHRKFYVKKKREIQALPAGTHQIPANDELGIPRYKDVIWSKEKAEKTRGR